MKTSEKGIELNISLEDFCPQAIKCLKSEKYYTIGFGHCGKDVKENDTITKSKAIDLLKSDLEKFEKKVNKYSSYDFTQNEYDALMSFCYNVGNIDQLTAKGTRSKKEIADKMLLYCKSGGKVIRGLQKRREKERSLFLKSSTSNFYPRYIGASNDLNTIFSAIGVPNNLNGSWEKRKAIATKNGIYDYVGSLTDNVKLIALAKNGKLKRVDQFHPFILYIETTRKNLF